MAGLRIDRARPDGAGGTNLSRDATPPDGPDRLVRNGPIQNSARDARTVRKYLRRTSLGMDNDMRNFVILTAAAFSVAAAALPASAATMHRHHHYQHGNVATNNFGRLHSGLRPQSTDPIKQDAQPTHNVPSPTLVPGNESDF